PGATVIQFDEPSLARIPGSPAGDLSLLADVSEALLDGVEATTIIAIYFGDVAPLGKEFFALPFHGFGLDFVAGEANFELLGDFPKKKILQAGLADARNTRLEKGKDIAAKARRLRKRVPDGRLWLALSPGLEVLPR